MGDDREDEEHLFEEEEPTPKKATEAGTATEEAVFDGSSRIGAVICTIFSIAITITFLILVAAILIMGGSNSGKEPLVNVNTSYVGPKENGTNSTGKGSGTPPPGHGGTTPEGEGGETTTRGQYKTPIVADRPSRASSTTGAGKDDTKKPKSTTREDVVMTEDHTKKVEPEETAKPTEKKAVQTTKAAGGSPREASTTTTAAKTTAKTTHAQTKKTTTTTVKPIPYNSLICTLNANMSQKTMSELPEDGLCDFAFYQAIEKDHAVLSGPGGPFAASFELIVRAAGQHTKTEYGLSFDYYFMNVTEKLLAEDVAKKTLDDLWKKKIYHYGFLLLSYFNMQDYEYRKVFRHLQTVKNVVERNSLPTRPSYFLVGETFCNTPLINNGFNNIRERMHVHGAVVYGHLIEDDRDGGQILPPSFWNWSTIIIPGNYDYNLGTAHSAISKLPHMKLGYTQFFLSVSMAGRQYTAFNDGKHEILGKSYVSSEPLLIDIAKVCKDREWVGKYREENPMGGYYVNNKTHRVLTYDDQKSLRTKLCEGKKMPLKEKYGLAAYDADLDDPGNVCGNGAYPRLRLLKKLVHFFNENFNAAGDYDACMKLQ